MGLQKEKPTAARQTSCKQCGICCRKGGAALHTEDLPLLQEQKIKRSDCLTLRKGEFAWSPKREKAEPIEADIIKLKGAGNSWVCCFLDSATNGCTIYKNRPVACRTLKCWQPEESIALAGNSLLTRQMIVQDEEPLLQWIEEYERLFPVPDFVALAEQQPQQQSTVIQKLEEQIHNDLLFRDRFVNAMQEHAADELFLFGRPLFQLFQQMGHTILQKGNRLCLQLHQ